MAKYILLINWTDQGVKSVKDSPKRLDAARKLAETAGAKMGDFYMKSRRQPRAMSPSERMRQPTTSAKPDPTRLAADRMLWKSWVAKIAIASAQPRASPTRVRSRRCAKGRSRKRPFHR